MKPAEDLTGLDLQGGWHVDGRVTQNVKGTGGYSSISYFASNKKGEKAFLKAIDLSSALQDDDLMGKSHELTEAYEHECGLLHQCKDKRLRRVVVPIAEGLAQVLEIYKPLDRVPYIIFPRSEGNIRDVLEQVSSHQTQPATLITSKLTKREVEVLRLIAKGLTNADIADRLFLSDGTVRNHVSAILTKLGVYDRTQAAVIAIQHGLT